MLFDKKINDSTDEFVRFRNDLELADVVLHCRIKSITHFIQKKTHAGTIFKFYYPYYVRDYVERIISECGVLPTFDCYNEYARFVQTFTNS